MDGLSSDESEGDPPVPIPTTVVKPFRADGTAGAARWESRSSLDSLLGVTARAVNAPVVSRVSSREKKNTGGRGEKKTARKHLTKNPGCLLLSTRVKSKESYGCNSLKDNVIVSFKIFCTLFENKK